MSLCLHHPSRLKRFASKVAFAFVLACTALPAWSQEWALYLAFDDAFSINFPGEPAIRDTTYETQFGIKLPARVYSAKDEFGTYSVTAVDWSSAETQHAEAYKVCMAQTGDKRGGENPGICSETRARNEISGATLHAAFSILKRGSNVVQFGLSPADGVEGVGIELLNRDESETFVQILWHEKHLYIAEATSPKGAPPASPFPVSIQFLDEEGRRIRYESRYSPLFPVPKRVR